MLSHKKPDHFELTIYPKNRDISKPWYVELTYTDPATNESCRKQYRNGINYYKTITERTREAKALVAALELKLSIGWNPIIDAIPAKDAHASLPNMPFNEALDFALESKKMNLEPKSYSDIKGVIGFAKVAAIKLRIHLNQIGETKRTHIKLILEQISKDRQICL